MSDQDTKYALEAHLKECELRYKIFEEKLDNLNSHQERINKHTFAASFAAISIVLGIIYFIAEIL